MKTKWVSLILPLVLTTAIATGCNEETNTQSEQEQVSDQLRPEKRHSPTDEETDDKLGYVRYQKDQVNNDHEKNRSTRIDRSKMADMITRMILRNDEFDEVSTLVTDREVLIAYQLNDDVNNQNASEIAGKTAKSSMPGFFDIYVSDNSTLMKDIQSLHNSSTNRNYDNTIDQITEKMEKISSDDQSDKEE